MDALNDLIFLECFFNNRSVSYFKNFRKTSFEHVYTSGWPQVMEFREVMEKSWNFIWSGKSHGKFIIYEKVMESHGTFFLMCIVFFSGELYI